MYVILGVIFSIIIALLLLLSLRMYIPNTNTIEKFVADVTTMPIKIEDHLCKGEGAFTGISNLYKEGTTPCVDSQCAQVKCWYMKGVDGEEDVFEFNNEFNHMRIIDRDPTTLQCLTKETLGNILKTTPVTVKNVDEVVYDPINDKLKNNVEQDAIPNTKYICFNHQTNITNMQMKTMAFNELNNPSSDMTVVIDIRGVFDFDERFICKRAIHGVINNFNMPITDIIYKRYLKKIINDDAYEVVYKRIAPKNITAMESNRFQALPYIHTVGMTKASLKALLMTICDSDCSNLTEKKFYEKDESVNEYKRVNFVDPISNPKQSIITSNTTDCELDSKKAVEDTLINKNEYAYEIGSDTYKLSFEYKNPDKWYENGDITGIENTLTTGCVVIRTEPIKEFPLDDEENWIYVTDRVCNPCDSEYDLDMQFNVGTLSLNANVTSTEHTYTKADAEQEPMKGFAKCSAFTVKYNCVVQQGSGVDDIIVKTNPMIIMKKKNKEVIAKHVINVFNADIVQSFEAMNTDLTFFDAFDIFENEYDNIVLFIDSGSYTIQMQNASITLHCKQSDVIEDGKCNIYNANLNECKYETQYYDAEANYECKDYDNHIECEAKYLNRKSTEQVVCESSENYSKTDKTLPLIHDATNLVRSYNDCVNLCDVRQGCMGIDFDIRTNMCSFYGYETSKLEVINSKATKYNIKTYNNNINMGMNEYENKTGTFTKILDPSVSFKKIIIQTDGEFKGTVRLFDYKNKLQKEFSNMNDDKNTNINHIARYETTPNSFELEVFYNEPENSPEPQPALPSIITQWENTNTTEVKIQATDAGADAYFGSVVAISGDYAIVGARGEDSGGTKGAAYIFKREGISWAHKAKLKSSQLQSNDTFGISVAISGDYAIVGVSKGAACIFKREGTQWPEQAILRPSDADADASDQFGKSVAISGDYAIVGAYAEDTSGSNAGAAYIFKRDGIFWDQEVQMQASDAESNDNFGWSVAISGDYVIVGAQYKNNAAGSAYIFKRNGNDWPEQKKIQASDAESNDNFGWSVAISGDYVIVGAYREDTGGSEAGSAYIFKRNGNEWPEQEKIQAKGAQSDDRFGSSVAISGDYAIVGAYGEDTKGSSAGAAFFFKYDGTSWVQEAKIKATDADYFGFSVAISGDYVIVGARRAGAAYIYYALPEEADSDSENVITLEGYENPGMTADISGNFGGYGMFFSGLS